MRDNTLPIPARLPFGGSAHKWHVSINRFGGVPGEGFPHFMYEAKSLADEVGRLPILFKAERENKLAATHRQCEHDHAGAPVPDNHLRCCLGVECRKCPYLMALDAAEMSPEEIDVAKTWTCVTHIVMSGGDQAREGYVLTVDDRMYWDNLYASMSSNPHDELEG
jgi:hypothetical protein